MKSVLVTGSNGLLGQKAADILLNEGFSVTGISLDKDSKCKHERFRYISADLTKSIELERIFRENEFSHVIHLAAIAHVTKGLKISWSRYYRVNTMMSRQIFKCASAAKVPIFFASTVDVYGITNRVINEKTKPNPIGAYAKSKYLAEISLMELAAQPYLIARFAPIYTDDNHKDIQKRYYIHYPEVCYKIGKGLEYEFLSAAKAANLIKYWTKDTDNYKNIINLCEDKRFNTKDLIAEDRKKGRANILVYIPQWIAKIMEFGIKICIRRKPFLIFTASKIFSPIRISRE